MQQVTGTPPVVSDSSAVSRDSSLIPVTEKVLGTPLVLTDDTTDFTIDLTVLAAGGVPGILQLYANNDFYEGEAAPASTTGLPRSASQIHSIPVKGRTVWHFKRVNALSTTIRAKLLLL